MSGPYRTPGDVKPSSIVDAVSAFEWLEKATMRSVSGAVSVPPDDFWRLVKHTGAKVEIDGDVVFFRVHTPWGVRRVEAAS